MRLNRWVHRLQGFIIGAVVIAIFAFMAAGGLLK